MSTIGGIGSYNGISLSGFRNKPSEVQGELALMTSNLEKTARMASAQSEQEFRAGQATEEGFARLRIALQNASPDRVETGISSGTLEKPPAEAEGDAALEAFQAYMAMTPAEKMRDHILKEMGLSEEDIEAMPPEQQKAVEEMIAQRMKERAQMQGARSYGLI